MQLPITQVDAFAHRAFTGNPAAVMPLESLLDDALLQAIAEENNLSETAFLVPDSSGAADYELRWFTPEVEIALCGHATLASGYVVLGDSGADEVSFRTRKSGILTVSKLAEGGYCVALPTLAGSPKSMQEYAAAMGGDVLETLWHPNGYGLFVYASAAEVVALTPDFAALQSAGDTLNIATAPSAGHVSGADVVSRVFAPAAGINEDPATGSAHCMITPYWAQRLGRNVFSAFQASARGAHIGCTLAGDRTILTGNCITTMTGVMQF